VSPDSAAAVGAVASAASSASREPGETMNVELGDIVMDFPGVRALDAVSLDFRFDEVHGLIGENGAGKSTLLAILAGTQRPSSGTLHIAGRPATFHSTRDARRQGIALVSQEGSLVPGLSAAENILLGGEPSRAGFVNRASLRRAAGALLETWFPGLDIDLDAPVDRLDMADRKVVEIVRALRSDIRLLILDEPTATLQTREKEMLWRIIRGLPGKGVGVVFVSHFLSEVKSLCDRISVLRDGRHVGTHPGAALSEADMVEMMLKRGLTGTGAAAASAQTDKAMPVLSVRNWHVGNVFVPRFDLHPGEIVGLIGLTGAGHLAFARSLYDGAGVTGGTLAVAGRAVTARGPRAMQRLGIGFVPDNRMTNALMAQGTIAENLSLVHPEAGKVAGFLSRVRERRESRRVMNMLNVRATGPAQTIRTLSGGNKQKVSLGKWLYGADARYTAMIFVEPTEGVDVGAKQEIYGHIRRFADAGVAVLIASSDLHEIEQITHRTLPFVGGRPGPEIRAAAYSEGRFITSMAGAAE
jgi:ABC-type sugar transport system ATPase subunit